MMEQDDLIFWHMWKKGIKVDDMTFAPINLRQEAKALLEQYEKEHPGARERYRQSAQGPVV